MEILLGNKKKQTYFENLELVQYLQSCSKKIPSLAAAMPLLKTNNISLVCQCIIEIILEYDMFRWLVTEKIVSIL